MGLGVLWPHADLLGATTVAIACLLGALIIPVSRNPAGGWSVFTTPIYTAASLLCSPATTFVGIVVGHTAGNFLFHRREWWRAPPNGFLLAFPAAVGAVMITRLDRSLPAAAAIAVGPAVVVASQRVLSSMLMTT